MDRIIIWLAALFIAGWPSLQAASRALIVTGLSGSAENSEEFNRLAQETRRLLAERRIPADHIKVLSGKVTRTAVLQKMEAVAANVAGDDEFWLVLYGHGGVTAGGLPAFQISGPRLTAQDLKAALDAIPGRQFVFIGTSASGGFLPILQDKRRAVLSATKEDGEGDLPRFPAQWVNALSENPQAAFSAIAARAAALTDEEYQRSNLAQGEHARLADPVTGTILAAPFGVNLTAEKEVASLPPATGAGLISASDIKITIRKPDAEWEQQPATAETSQIMAEAQAAPNPDGHSAIVLQQQLGFTVEQDRTTNRRTFWRVYLTRNEAVEEWANQFFPQSPPMITTKLEVARVIQPDGSSTVFNPAKLPACTDPNGGCGAMAMVFLPNARAGCVIEVGSRTSELLDATLPEVSVNIPLLRNAPALQTTLEICVPEKPVHHVSLRNVDAAVQESSEPGRRVYRWKLPALPAMESLPGDPPATQWAAYAAISSLPSWDEFATWYRRLAQGSDVIDATVQKMARQLAEGASSRTEKIRRDFEFVSALRYVAIEIGVQGFRPRTPAQVLANRYGDCKDKANLLVALMKCQDIDADFVLLNRGGQTDVEFPSWQFNHAIAYVAKAPESGQSEDLWLDSTDGVTPFGYVPPGDFGRNGLVFSKEQAVFKTVAGSAAQTSEIRDEWELTEQPDASWKGRFHRQASGIADDQLRRAFRNLSPAQRSTQLYQMMMPLWADADFSNAAVNGTDDFAKGVALSAEASAPAGEWPRMPMPGSEVFSAPTRPRALWLNDGQPLHLTQTLRLHYDQAAPEKLPTPMQTNVAGQKLSVEWQRVDARTLLRTARLELSQPIVPAADYVSLRSALRAWNSALHH